MSRTLAEITSDLAKYHEALDAAGGEIGLAAESLGMTQPDFEKAYDAVAFEDATKLDAYLYRMEESVARAASAKAMWDQWKARADEWAAKVKAEEKSHDFMKSRLKFRMEALGDAKVVTAEGRVLSIQKNGGVLPLAWNDDAFNSLTAGELSSLESEGLVIMQPTIDKAACRKALEEGKELAFAALGKRGTSLRIK